MARADEEARDLEWERFKQMVIAAHPERTKEWLTIFSDTDNPDIPLEEAPPPETAQDAMQRIQTLKDFGVLVERI